MMQYLRWLSLFFSLFTISLQPFFMPLILIVTLAMISTSTDIDDLLVSLHLCLLPGKEQQQQIIGQKQKTKESF